MRYTITNNKPNINNTINNKHGINSINQQQAQHQIASEAGDFHERQQ
jgi:hypothetical protein